MDQFSAILDVEIVAGHGKNLRVTIGWRHLGMIPEAVGHNYSGDH
jgi:hypothetical protein